MSVAHREWQLDLAKSGLQDNGVEAICERKVAEHRERRKIGPGGKLEYQEIDVSQNSITWRGCTTILDVCLQCKDLRVVKLFKNELSDLAAPALCRLVEECRGLEQLHLSYNLLTAAGAKDIVTAAHRGRVARLQASEKDKKKAGFTLWLRLEHNKISNGAGLLEELKALGVEFCEARDASKCGPRHCKHCAPLHLPYFSKQNAETPECSPVAAVPKVSVAGIGGEKKSPRPPPPAIPSLPPTLKLQETSAQAARNADGDDESEGCASSSESVEVIDLPPSTGNALETPSKAVPPAALEETGTPAQDAPEGAKSEAPSGTSEPPELLATSDPYALDIELDAEEFDAPEIIAALKTPAAIDPEVLEPVKETDPDSEEDAELEGDFNIASPVDDAPVETPVEAEAKEALASKVEDTEPGLTAEEKAFEASVKNLAEAASRRRDGRSRSRDTGLKRPADAQTADDNAGTEKPKTKDDSHQRKHDKKLKKDKQDKGERKRKHSSDGSGASEGRASKKHRKHKRDGSEKKDRDAKDVKNSKDEKEVARPSGSPPQAHPKGHAAGILAMRPVQLSKKPEKTKEQAAAEVKEAFGLNDDDDSREKDAKEQKEQKDAKDAKESKDGKHSKHKKDSKEHKDKESKKASKEAKDSKEAGTRGDAGKKKTTEEKPKSAAEDKAKSTSEEKPKAAAKGLAGLGNIAELQKQIADERAKLRLFVIKAKQEWEERRERGKARGETNDQEYYIASEGEIFGPNKEFSVVGSIGRGVFSSVFEVKNTKEGDKSYAVKFVRSNHMMRKAAEKEVELYRRLAKQTPKEDAEAAQFLMFLSAPETFIHQGHLAMIFELQKCDLRTAMHKYGQGKGLPLQTVAQYVKQIMLGLRVLRKLKIIHGDLKPDNILMSLSKTEVKVCDFGSAMDVSTAEEVKTAYAQPRYYRAPEIIIGIGYDTQIDLWSAGCTAFELGTGKILFTGRTNHAMLRAMLDTCGEFPKRMATEGTYASKHFNANGDMVHKDPDSLTGLPEVLKMKNFQRPPKPVTSLVDKVLKEPPPNADNKTQERLLPRLADLVQKCIRIDQGERITPDLALQHNFFKKGG